MLGVCLGMQLTCIEFARHVLGLEGPIHPNWIQKPSIQLSISCETKSMWKTWEERSVSVFTHLNSNEDQKAAAAYDNQEVVQRRHRHRYEFNNAFREQFEEAGFVFSGVSPDNRLVEIVEIQKTNSLLLANTTQNCQAVQTAQKDFTQPLSQRQLKTTIANKNQGSRLKYLLPFLKKMTNSEKV